MPNIHQDHQFTTYGVGRWHHPPVSAASQVSHNSGVTGCHAFPFFTPNGKTLGITQIGMYCGGSTGDAGTTDMTCQIALYTSNSSYYPDSLLHDTGSLTVNTNGIKTDGAFTEIQLTPNTLYYFATKKNNTPSGAASSVANYYCANATTWMPYNTTDVGIVGADDDNFCLKGTQAGNFPATFAAGFTVTGQSQMMVPFFYVNSVT